MEHEVHCVSPAAGRIRTNANEFSVSEWLGDVPRNDGLKDNGITVAPSKVFDTFTLRQMLAGTVSQLAAISGF